MKLRIKPARMIIVVAFAFIEALALKPLTVFLTGFALDIIALAAVFVGAMFGGILLFEKWKAPTWAKVGVAVVIVVGSYVFAVWLALYTIRYSLMNGA